MHPVDLWTGPLARTTRLSADALSCGWPDGQPLGVAHAPTHRPSAAHKLHRVPSTTGHPKTQDKSTDPGGSQRSSDSRRPSSKEVPCLDKRLAPTIFLAQPRHPTETGHVPEIVGHVRRNTHLVQRGVVRLASGAAARPRRRVQPRLHTSPVSAIRAERCPPSRRNAVRHHGGTVSGMARNTHPRHCSGAVDGYSTRMLFARTTSPHTLY